MGKGPCTFRQRDVTAAMKAGGAFAISVGIPVDRVQAKIDTDGTIRITVASEADSEAPKAPEDATSLIG